MLGALTIGETAIEGLLEGEDVLATAEAMRSFGATATRTGPGTWRVQGLGVGGLLEPTHVIDYGNAGTGVRLAMGIAGSHSFATTFTGDGLAGEAADGARVRSAAAHGRAGAGAGGRQAAGDHQGAGRADPRSTSASRCRRRR